MRLGIRAKMLLIMIALFTTAILSYLVMAVNLFNEDKIAYVYDSNTTIAVVGASEVQAMVKGLERIFNLSAIAAVDLGSKDSSRTIHSLFYSDPSLVELQIYRARSQPSGLLSDLTSLLRLQKKSFFQSYQAKENYFDLLRKKSPIPLEMLRANRMYFQRSSAGSDKNGPPLLTVAIPYQQPSRKGEQILVVANIDPAPFVEILNRSSIYSAYLIDSFGNIIVQPSQNFGSSNLTQYEEVRNILQSKVTSGALEYEKNKAAYILAYAKVEMGELAVLSEIRKEKALLASYRFIEKSIMLALVIILISIVVSILFSKKLTAAIKALSFGAHRISEGDFQINIISRSADEVGALTQSFNFMAHKIVGLMSETAEKAKLEKELDTAKMVQSTFFPKDAIQSGPLQLVGKYQPATQCGGDWWGHFGANGVDYVFIADAMGHGVPAALVTAMAYSSCMTIADIIRLNPQSATSPSFILDRFNQILCEAVGGKITMTFFAAVFDFHNYQLTYSNAGHNFPILLPTDRQDDRISKKNRASDRIDSHEIPLRLNGSPLGFDRQAKFEDKQMKIRGGDKIFFYTDGLIECTSPDGKMWGKRSLMKQLGLRTEEPAADLNQNIYNDAFEHFNQHPIDDDITVVVAEIAA